MNIFRFYEGEKFAKLFNASGYRIMIVKNWCLSPKRIRSFRWGCVKKKKNEKEEFELLKNHFTRNLRSKTKGIFFGCRYKTIFFF